MSLNEAEDIEDFEDAVEECLSSAEELIGSAQATASMVKTFLSKNSSNNVSLFDVKNHELIAKILEASGLMAILASGEPISLGEINDNLAQLNGILDSIREIEDEIKPQFENLSSGKTGKSEMSMRARPDMLADSSDEEEDTPDKIEQQKAINKSKYQAPKLVPMSYNENEEERKAKQVERARKRAMQSSLIQDLRSQYSDAPILISEQPSMSKLEQETKHYEENNYVRYQMTKKEKQLTKRKQNQNTLDSLTKFGDYMAMDTVLEDGGLKASKRKKSRGVKRRGGLDAKKSKKSTKRKR